MTVLPYHASPALQKVPALVYQYLPTASPLRKFPTRLPQRAAFVSHAAATSSTNAAIVPGEHSGTKSGRENEEEEHHQGVAPALRHKWHEASQPRDDPPRSDTRACNTYSSRMRHGAETYRARLMSRTC